MILVSSGQSLIDICLQELGDLAALFELADANDRAITDPLTPGQVLQVPATVTGRPELVAYFAARRQRLNAGDTPPPPPPVRVPDFNQNDLKPSDFA